MGKRKVTILEPAATAVVYLSLLKNSLILHLLFLNIYLLKVLSIVLVNILNGKN
jgi:hypothetical protein